MDDKKTNDALRKMSKAEDAKKAMAEYHAQQAAVDANTARLRELRLAKEAAEAAAAPAKPVKKAAAKKTKAGKADKVAPGKLSDWLKDQQNSGRRS
jgi:hypothetical protein